MKPHKHAELIKAWADGADIEHFSVPARLWMYTAHPAWNPENQYRIKPEPRPDVVYYGVFDRSANGALLDAAFTMFSDQGDQIKITFDGETGKLKSAEVL